MQRRGSVAGRNGKAKDADGNGKARRELGPTAREAVYHKAGGEMKGGRGSVRCPRFEDSFISRVILGKIPSFFQPQLPHI